MEDLGFLEKDTFPLSPRKISGNIILKNYSASCNSKKILKVKKEYRTDVKIRH